MGAFFLCGKDPRDGELPDFSPCSQIEIEEKRKYFVDMVTSVV